MWALYLFAAVFVVVFLYGAVWASRNTIRRRRR